MLKKEEMITLLKNDVVPAHGCTEPVSVALCAANAGKMTENKICSREVEVNAGIYKNGMSAGIPGCDYVGLPYAAALGAYLKNPEKGLELLEDITPEILEQMKELCGMAAVSVKIKEHGQGLYVKCKIKTEADMITSVIRGTHTNLVYLEKNGKIIYEKNQENGQASDNALIEALKQMTIAQIRQVADTASEEELHFLMDGVEMNERLAAYSEDKKVGVGIADTLRSEKGSEVLKNDLLTRIMLKVSSAAESRLDGCPLPTMSSSGAGTKGLVVILPVSEAADALEVSMEKKVRAAIEDALQIQNRETKIEEEMVARVNVLKDISASMARDLGREATLAELAERMKMSEDEIRDIMKLTMDAMKVSGQAAEMAQKEIDEQE